MTNINIKVNTYVNRLIITNDNQVVGVSAVSDGVS